MPTSKKAFWDLHADQQEPIETRVLNIVKRCENALSAQEVTGQLVGVTGRYTMITSEAVAHALPEVTTILETAVQHRLIQKAYEKRGALGERTPIYCSID